MSGNEFRRRWNQGDDGKRFADDTIEPGPELAPLVELETVCAWCPDFKPADHKGKSHTICPSCAARVLGEPPSTT